MNQLSVYLKIVRPLNLLMVVVTQLLFWFFIINTWYRCYNDVPNLHLWQVILLSLSTVLIAAGGYVINDFYDLPIDLVNKPEKVLIGQGISDDAAFNYYTILTILGLAASLIVAISISNYMLIVLPIIITSMLWFYAQSFKRAFLIGNLVVSLATASVILLLIVFEFDWANLEKDARQAYEIIKYAAVYMGFAFLTSMLRELIKDLQDREGDEEFECKTIPIVLGEKAAKFISIVWLLLLMVGVGYIQSLFLTNGNQIAFGYLLIFIQLPCLWIAFRTVRAETKQHYSHISLIVKAVMFFGIITMAYIGIILKCGS